MTKLDKSVNIKFFDSFANEQRVKGLNALNIVPFFITSSISLIAHKQNV